MDHFSAGVLVLTPGSEGQGKDLTVSAFSNQVTGGIFHGQFRA